MSKAVLIITALVVAGNTLVLNREAQLLSQYDITHRETDVDNVDFPVAPAMRHLTWWGWVSATNYNKRKKN